VRLRASPGLLQHRGTLNHEEGALKEGIDKTKEVASATADKTVEMASVTADKTKEVASAAADKTQEVRPHLSRQLVYFRVLVPA
jgi:hypothetical protein